MHATYYSVVHMHVYSQISEDLAKMCFLVYGTSVIRNIHTIGLAGGQIILSHSIVRDSVFNGGSSNAPCLALSLSADNHTIINNAFQDCTIGIAMYFSSTNTRISYNIFQSNLMGIQFQNAAQASVHYNNFQNNSIDIESTNTNSNKHNCSYNYYGTSEPRIISDKITDGCDGSGSG